MTLKRLAAGAAMLGALGLGTIGAASVAQADPYNPCGYGYHCGFNGPPGHNPFGPPGQVKHGNPYVPGLTGVPPGHWGGGFRH